MIRFFLFMGLTGCLPKGAYPLTPLALGPSASGTLSYSSSAALDSVPGMGVDLAVRLTLENTGDQPIRIDLTRARLSVDEQPFLTCRHGSTADPAMLLTTLSKGEKRDVQVTCRDIAKPIHKAEFKFIASGTGANAEVVVGWAGLGERI